MNKTDLLFRYKSLILQIFSLLLVGVVLIYPNVVYTAREGAGMSYIMTSVLYALPVVAVVALLPRRWAYSVAVGLFGIASIIDLTMVDLFHSYILPGAIISTLMTNTHEATEFYRANVAEALQWLPIVGLCVLSCLTYHRPHYNKTAIAAVATAFVLPMGFVAYKLVGFYQSRLTTRYFVDNRILNRPPYNVFYQSANAVRDLRKRALLAHAKETDFGAVRITPPHCEVYVMAIGESLRYSSLSLNGQYPRSTTPQLERMNNLLLFDNYYSQGCLTMLSVPMLVTRATPDNFDLCYAERSIVEPFRECGFHTFAIVCSNLLADEKYLTDGVDSLIVVPNRMENGRSLSGDKTIAHIVDSLAQRHEKLFVLMQFLGNHAYYTNYEAEYEFYRPNSNNCTEAERANSDSLYINSYDNCTRYTDYVLSSIIQAIDRPNTIAAFAFVSDHGENLGPAKTAGGHGGDCRPRKDEYHVPFLFWYSDDYAEFYPEKVAAAKAHKAAPINGDCMFYSVCDMAGITIDSAYAKPSWSVFATEFSPHPRYVLVPDGVTTIRVE